MASYQEGSSIEICLGHKREQSQDSGAYIDWNSEDSASPVNSSDSTANDDFITVVAVENGGKTERRRKDEASFVTILAIGEADETSEKAPPLKDVEEEVLVYRLPGERLGFGLKFEGGTNTAENVKRLFIQSSAPDSPASRAKCSWGTLVEGDEILKIDGNVVKNMTRLDCVRCLKESSVVIKLFVRHRKQKRNQQSNRIIVENAGTSSPTVVSAEMKKNIPPPPPVPPRKITKKFSASASKEPAVNALENFCDLKNNDPSPVPKTRIVQNGGSEELKISSKNVVRGPQKSDQGSPELSKNSTKRHCTDLKVAPPEPKVYLDLLAQEESRNGESESDDTCSTVSTVVGLSSAPATNNSSFSDLRSSASSFCDSTNPSTPTSEPTTPVLEMSRILSPFDSIQNSDFLLTKLINDKDQDDIFFDDKNSTCSEEVIPLQPPLNFQDAPLSYGNEEMRANLTEGLTVFEDETFISSSKIQSDVLGDSDQAHGSGKFKEKTKDCKKPSLIPRLAKSIGLLSPPKPSPRKESKAQEGSNKSRFHKKKTSTSPCESSETAAETESKILKSSIPYLKKKKSKSEDHKKSGKGGEKQAKTDETNAKKQLFVAIVDGKKKGEQSKDSSATETAKPAEAEEALTWEVPNLKNVMRKSSQPDASDVENVYPKVDGFEPAALRKEEILSPETSGKPEISDHREEGCESLYVFLWSGSKHLETIGEDEEDATADDMGLERPQEKVRDVSPSENNDIIGNDLKEFEDLDLPSKEPSFETKINRSGEVPLDVTPETSETNDLVKNRSDESSATRSKHANSSCNNDVLAKLDDDSLEEAKKAVDLNNSNGDLKEEMVPVVSTTTVGLVASTTNFRGPTSDGREFLRKCTDKDSKKKPSKVTAKTGKESQCLEEDAELPPLPSSEPPSLKHHKHQPLILSEGDAEVVPFSRKSTAVDSTSIVKPPRNSLWRQDEKSEKSVRDKIAMFSSVPDSTSSPSHGSGNLSKHKSSEDVFFSDELDTCGNVQSRRIFSKSVVTLDKVSGAPNYYVKKPYSEASTTPRSLDYSNRAQSSVDLSSSSAYSSSCSPDSSLSSNSSSYLSSSCTLPRKKTRSDDNKAYPDAKSGNIQRATSFVAHGRSQSLLDVNPNSFKSRYQYEGTQEVGGQKSGALNLLMEQRRKNLTKLRGLVIPEKLGDAAPSEPIVDLPEIRSRDSILNAKLPDAGKAEKSVASKWSRPVIAEVSEPKITPTHLWNLQHKSPNIPKYSPAFKRKSISVFGGKEPSISNGKKEISVNPFQRCNAPETPKVPPLKPPRNAPLVRQNSVSDDRRYQDGVASVLCESELSYPTEKSEKTGCVANDAFKLTESYVPKRKATLQGRYRLSSDLGRSEEDSDNDSAVSSSRSSMSHGFSPPGSPVLGVQVHQSVEDVGQSSRSRLSPDGIIPTRTTGTSEPAPSTTYLDGNGNDVSNKRILKPQSVEAINRKNVLTSAKFSRGFDAKSGSPLIQRRFAKEIGERDFPQTLNQILLISDKKHCPNNIDVFKEPTLQRPVEKIAYITDVVDPENPGEFKTVNKKRVEKSASLPTTGEQISTLKKVNLPSETSWGTENVWTRSSFECVPNNNPKEDINARSKSFEKLGDKDGNFNFLKNGDGKTAVHVDARATKDPSSAEKSIADFKLNNEAVEATPNANRRVSGVSDIRRTFEKAEVILPRDSEAGAKNGSSLSSAANGLNGLGGIHGRMSSLDSTTSDDGPYGCSSNPFREQHYGSITSLASSTSLISPQELQLLIEEANQTLEESNGNANGASTSTSHDVIVIILHRDTVGGSIGITLAGGADYESKEITVHKVLAGSPADRDGRIQKGDRILSINGKSMKGVTHRESLAILKSPRLEVVLVVSRLKNDAIADGGNSEDGTSAPARSSYATSLNRPPRILERSTLIEPEEPSSRGSDSVLRGPPVTLLLVKDGAGLGFSLEGGKDCSTGDKPLVVKKIFTGGVAEKCGQLKAGDEILNINGVDVSLMSRIDAWKLMKTLPDGNVAITVKRQVVSNGSKSNSNGSNDVSFGQRHNADPSAQRI